MPGATFPSGDSHLATDLLIGREQDRKGLQHVEVLAKIGHPHVRVEVVEGKVTLRTEEGQDEYLRSRIRMALLRSVGKNVLTLEEATKASKIVRSVVERLHIMGRIVLE